MNSVNKKTANFFLFNFSKEIKGNFRVSSSQTFLVKKLCADMITTFLLKCFIMKLISDKAL